MTDMTTIVENSMADAMMDGLPEYDRFTHIGLEVMKFKGMTISEWQEQVSVPIIPESFSIQELEDFNVSLMQVNEEVMSNLSTARVSHEMCKIAYSKSMVAAKEAILARIEASNSANNKKRVPGKEALDDISRGQCMPEYLSVKVANLFLEFWVTQYEKLKFANDRINNFSYMKSTESRVGR